MTTWTDLGTEAHRAIEQSLQNADLSPTDKAARMLDALTGLTVGVAARAAIAQFLANVTTEQLAALFDLTVGLA